MRNFATLCDSRYLPQGLALYDSLLRHSSEPFTLYVLPLDQETVDTLTAMVLPNLQMVLGFHESHPGMQEAQGNRTHQEYAWTCASNLCEALMATGLDEVTYLDADLYFFSNPAVIFDEIGDRSIAVIPHRLIPSKKYLEVNGKFNVSWVTFKNNAVGRECLSIWAAQCREKCSATDGCGDQKYLDAWPNKYGDELCIIQNIGAGLAPWNLANYVLYDSTDGLTVTDVEVWPKARPKVRLAVFYHYHEYIHGERLTNYELRPEDIRLIYEPYIKAIDAAKQAIADTKAVCAPGHVNAPELI